MKKLFILVVLFLSVNVFAQQKAAEAIMKKQVVEFYPPQDQLPAATMRVSSAISSETLDGIIDILEENKYTVVKGWFKDRETSNCVFAMCCTDIISVEKDGNAYGVIIFNEYGKVSISYCDYKDKTTRM